MPDVGEPIPALDHAVSVSLPSWEATVGYEQGAEWVLSKMRNGYPRFFINLEIRDFADSIVTQYGFPGQKAMLFPSVPIARQCIDFIERNSGTTYHGTIRVRAEKNAAPCILDLVLHDEVGEETNPETAISAALFPEDRLHVALKFWQHTGEGISSRRARVFHKAFIDGCLGIRSEFVIAQNPKPCEAKDMTESEHTHCSESHDRKSTARIAKLAIRRRLTGNFDTPNDLQEANSKHSEQDAGEKRVSADDAFLYPSGMSSIYNVHRVLLKARGALPSIMFGFPYTDTLKVLENFGPGCVFYGHCSSSELDNLQERCENGEKFLALFCEFPGNPLLKTPDLRKINELASRFGFAIVVDETIGNFLNVNVLPSADVVMNSLTKAFSGTGNVMGGSCVLNPRGRYYDILHKTISQDYQDNYWPDDAIVMEQNSRDFVSRNSRMNESAERLCQRLKESSIKVKKVYYPKFCSTRWCFDAYRTPCGGYGALFSLTFHNDSEARCFFNALETAKGPSLGTNFTLSSPFVILAHYHELDWAARYGVEANLIRVSVGLEEFSELLCIFERALRAVENLNLC